jgi:hypothetical protein
MAGNPRSEGFEDFVRWLAGARPDPTPDLSIPALNVSSAATVAWQESQSLRRAHLEALAERVRAGSYREEVELMAAADTDHARWLPRLRTPNGFAISALYPAETTAGSAPVALLVECPLDLTEIFRGQKVHILAAGRWIEIGEIDVDGKATGDLPASIDFRPPFGLRVGELQEQPEDVADADRNEPQ